MKLVYTAVGGLEIVQDFEDSGAPNGVSGRKLADQIAQGEEHPPTRGTETNDIGLDGLRRADGYRTPHDVHSDRNLAAGELAGSGQTALELTAELNGGTGADLVGEAEMTQGKVVIIIDELRDAAGMSADFLKMAQASIPSTAVEKLVRLRISS